MCIGKFIYRIKGINFHKKEEKNELLTNYLIIINFQDSIRSQAFTLTR
jgi:hypothetical protein